MRASGESARAHATKRGGLESPRHRMMMKAAKKSTKTMPIMIRAKRSDVHGISSSTILTATWMSGVTYSRTITSQTWKDADMLVRRVKVIT